MTLRQVVTANSAAVRTPADAGALAISAKAKAAVPTARDMRFFDRLKVDL
jgi:hypothetical protein